MKKIQPMDVKANGHYSQGGTGGALICRLRVFVVEFGQGIDCSRA